MYRKMLKWVTVLGCISILLTACQPAAAQPTAPAKAEPTKAPVPAATSAPAAAAQPTAPAKAEPTKAAVPAATSAPAAAAPTQIPLKPGQVLINGAGASFPLPVYSEWTYAYQKVDPTVVINYQGTGSGGGKKAIVDNTVDFAGSDSLVTDEEYKSGKDLQMYPVLAGAVVAIYNLEGVKNTDPTMILDGKTLVGIFNGTIKKWNDPAIVALNPELKAKLPAKDMTVVHRSDGSGTTEIFTKSLSAFSPDWKAGGASSVEWPVDKAGNGIGGRGNPGVAAAVQNTPNSIGYVELAYAVENKILYSKMINKSGKLVSANADSLASAMNDFAGKFDAKLTSTIVDAPGEKSWPMSAYTYLVLHTTSMTDCNKAGKLLGYIKWTLTDPAPAKRAAELGYAVLPEAVQKAVLAKLGEVTCSGKPVLK